MYVLFQSHKTLANVRSQAPKITAIWNNRHVLTWATKHACARVHQTFFEGEDGESTPPVDEEADHSPEDSEEPSPKQDLVQIPIPSNRNGPSTRAIIIWTG